MNKVKIDYGYGIIFYFDNYPQEYEIVMDWSGEWVQRELPTTTLRVR